MTPCESLLRLSHRGIEKSLRAWSPARGCGGRGAFNMRGLILIRAQRAAQKGIPHGDEVSATKATNATKALKPSALCSDCHGLEVAAEAGRWAPGAEGESGGLQGLNKLSQATTTTTLPRQMEKEFNKKSKGLWWQRLRTKLARPASQQVM